VRREARGAPDRILFVAGRLDAVAVGREEVGNPVAGFLDILDYQNAGGGRVSYGHELGAFLLLVVWALMAWILRRPGPGVCTLAHIAALST